MAQQTVVGVFDDASDAQKAVSELQSAGFNKDSVDMASRGSAGTTSGASSGTDSDHYNKSGTWVEGAADSVGRSFEGNKNDAGTGRNSNDTNSSGTMVEGAADSAGRGAEEGGSAIGRFFRNLFSDNDDEYNRYSSVAEESNSIVTVHADSADRAQQAADIMDRCGAVDVDERASQYGVSGGTRNTRQNMSGDARTADTDQTVQVIQEDIQVGKREVNTGGARLRSRIVERPVEEDLRLREERVFVNRNSVNRPATDADFNTFRDGTIELTETAEVPVVQKEARVVEEVSLGKQVDERTETIRDSVRSTEVEVERLEGDQQNRSSGYTGTSSSSVDQ